MTGHTLCEQRLFDRNDTAPKMVKPTNRMSAPAVPGIIIYNDQGVSFSLGLMSVLQNSTVCCFVLFGKTNLAFSMEGRGLTLRSSKEMTKPFTMKVQPSKLILPAFTRKSNFIAFVLNRNPLISIVVKFGDIEPFSSVVSFAVQWISCSAEKKCLTLNVIGLNEYPITATENSENEPLRGQSRRNWHEHVTLTAVPRKLRILYEILLLMWHWLLSPNDSASDVT